MHTPLSLTVGLVLTLVASGCALPNSFKTPKPRHFTLRATVVEALRYLLPTGRAAMFHLVLGVCVPMKI